MFTVQKKSCAKELLCSAKFEFFQRFGLTIRIILRQAEYVNTEICSFLRSLVSRGRVVCYRISDVLNDYELVAGYLVG
jgi:hypothetical protein